MRPGSTDRAATFAALFAAMLAAHQLGDHIVQTDAQATGKPGPGPHGWSALGRHVASYHLAMAATVGVTVRVTGAPVTARGLAAGIAVSAASHALWDRRRPVVWLLERTGAGRFAQLADHGMNGPYLADQALHIACLWAAALIATTL